MVVLDRILVSVWSPLYLFVLCEPHAPTAKKKIMGVLPCPCVTWIRFLGAPEAGDPTISLSHSSGPGDSPTGAYLPADSAPGVTALFALMEGAPPGHMCGPGTLIERYPRSQRPSWVYWSGFYSGLRFAVGW